MRIDAMRIYGATFTMVFRGQFAAKADDDAQANLDQIGPGEVWDSDDWILEGTQRELTGSFDDPDDPAEAGNAG